MFSTDLTGGILFGKIRITLPNKFRDSNEGDRSFNKTLTN